MTNRPASAGFSFIDVITLPQIEEVSSPTSMRQPNARAWQVENKALQSGSAERESSSLHLLLRLLMWQNATFTLGARAIEFHAA